MTQAHMFDVFGGKSVLVTGASSGIGKALAIRLAELGARVACTARTEARVKAVAADITASGGEALAIAADATKEAEMTAMSDRLTAEFGGLDYAYLNAGANSQKGSVLDSDYEAWRAGFDQNMLPVLLGIKAAVPLMQARGGGRIIFTGTAMAHYATPQSSSYSAGKAAARMIARTAALELVEDNITVNEFIPGPVRTEQAMKLTDPDDPTSPFNNPLEWVKEPEDVVDTMLFMAALPGKGPNSQIFSLARR